MDHNAKMLEKDAESILIPQEAEQKGNLFKTSLIAFAKEPKEFCINTIGDLKAQKLADPQSFNLWLKIVKDSLDGIQA